jgi:hypothetical protein
MRANPIEEFNATKQAREWAGDDYANYIQTKLVAYIQQNIRTLEEIRALNIEQLLTGNDGE